MGSDFPVTLSPLGLLSGSRQEAVSSGDMCEGGEVGDVWGCLHTGLLSLRAGHRLASDLS